MNTELKSYITKDNKRIGLVVAKKVMVDGKLSLAKIGWSVINPTSDDVFDKELAHKIAYGRIEKGSDVIIPQHVLPHMEAMGDRAVKYFKCDGVWFSGLVIRDMDKYWESLNSSKREAKAVAK